MVEDFFKRKIPFFNINNSLPVARPGLPFIISLLVLSAICFLFGWRCLTTIFFILFLFNLWFFRDPDRLPPPGDFGLSPADGRIIRIDQNSICPISGENAIKVSIFLNLFNVHVNRSPIAGSIISQDYRAGKFFNASFDKASDQNERRIMLLEDEKGRRIVCSQIAGLIARRVVSWVEPGQSLKRGQRFGMILFGSRVDIYLPLSVEIMVGLGQKVLAGWSPIWRYRD
ncbi:MAG: phosphatidylserine decarboxylase family protein [Deltaproteobacteria bacterium]|jgi:phosphatidylserine decarboxylase|nr:phosphatidylserine decarboxylase family protein [Deltaproteobacteria bacterium]